MRPQFKWTFTPSPLPPPPITHHHPIGILFSVVLACVPFVMNFCFREKQTLQFGRISLLAMLHTATAAEKTLVVRRLICDVSCKMCCTYRLEMRRRGKDRKNWKPWGTNCLPAKFRTCEQRNKKKNELWRFLEDSLPNVLLREFLRCHFRNNENN